MTRVPGADVSAVSFPSSLLPSLPVSFRLPNNLKAIVVSDPTTEKAAAALSVRVGAKHDPAEAPGLAHFCEHMVREREGE